MAASPFKITVTVEPFSAGSGEGSGWQPQAAAATTGGKWCCICGKSLKRENLNPTCGVCFNNAVSLLPADLQLPPWAGAAGYHRRAPAEAPPAAPVDVRIPRADAAAPADAAVAPAGPADAALVVNAADAGAAPGAGGD